MNFVLIGSFAAASSMARWAVARSTPSISKMIRPGLTTATQPSGAPLPLPMRVSAGFFVIGLSGKMRIQSLPPRLTKRVMATRPASICFPVTQAASVAFKAYSPNAMPVPRLAAPERRPRCCLRYLTFLGILYSAISLSFHHCLARVHDVTAVDPNLDADDAEGRVGLGEAVIDVGAKRVQRQTPVQGPFGAGDLGAVQTARDADLDAERAEALRLIDGLAHGAAKRDALLQLLRDLLGLELGVQLGLLDLADVDQDFAARAPADLLFQLVDLGALAPDDDARARGVDDDPQPVRRAIDLDLRNARAGEAGLQLPLQVEVFDKQLAEIALREPA